jgi:hypothetical protein
MIDNHAIDVTVNLAIVHECIVDAQMAALLDECPDGLDTLPVHRVAIHALDGAREHLAALPADVVHDMLLVALTDDARADAQERIALLDKRLVVGDGGHIEAVKAAPRCPTPDVHATYHGRSETYRRQRASGITVPTAPGVCDWCGLSTGGV